MRQKYKIYINNYPLILVARQEDINEIFDPGMEVVMTWYRGRTKQLSPIIDTLEKATRPKAFVVIYADLQRLWGDFKSLFRYIKAAGGLVFNGRRELLMIYRRGYWDLPKGKIDPGETKRVAAIREVKEETGLQTVIIRTKVDNTFHTYRLKSGKRALKKSIWYEMTTPDLKLTPQKEEDIERAEWMLPAQIQDQCDPMYPSIREILKSEGVLR